LILTIIVAYLIELLNDRKSMMSILKKFFVIKTADPTFLKHKFAEADEPNIY